MEEEKNADKPTKVEYVKYEENQRSKEPIKIKFIDLLIVIITAIIILIALVFIIIMQYEKNNKLNSEVGRLKYQIEKIRNEVSNNVSLKTEIENLSEKNTLESNDETVEEKDTESDLNSEELNLSKISDETLEWFKKRIGSICYQYENIEEVEGFNSTSITFYSDNTCSLGFYQISFGLKGTYTKDNNTIRCKINSLSTERTNQDVDTFEIVFKDIGNNKIKVQSVSIDNITARLEKYSLTTTVLSDETVTIDLSSLIDDNILYTNYVSMFEKTYKEYLKLSDFQNSRIGPMDGILVELGLSTREELDKIIEASGLNHLDTSSYIKSNVKYDLFKEKMLQYMTEELFNEKYSQYKNIDGYVGFCDCAGGIEPVEYCSAILPSEISKGKFVFQVLMKDVVYYDHYMDGDEFIKENDCYCIRFVNTKYENGKIKIDIDSNNITN